MRVKVSCFPYRNKCPSAYIKNDDVQKSHGVNVYAVGFFLLSFVLSVPVSWVIKRDCIMLGFVGMRRVILILDQTIFLFYSFMQIRRLVVWHCRLCARYKAPRQVSV